MIPIYLDYNATTPVDPEVAAAMLPYLQAQFGNPSSAHWYGAQAKRAVEEARRQVATLIGCQTDEIVFTSGGSEANNLAIKGYCQAHADRGRHLIVSAIEHPAVMEVARYLEGHGWSLSILPVDAAGMVDPEDLRRALRPDTILVSVMHANNEVGTIQPIAELAAIAHDHRIIFHCDAAQSAGKVPVRVDELGVDLLSIAGHKLYAPKGVGVLFIRRGVTLEKLIHGANHERDLRAGTENVLEIAGLGKACEIAARDLEKNAHHMRRMRDRLWQRMNEHLEEVRRNGHAEKVLPNTLSLSFRGLEANAILSQLQEVAASAGAACHADQVTVSAVLQAMDVPLEWAMGTIRFSTGRMTTEEEVDRAAEATAKVARGLRGNEGEARKMDSVQLTQFTHGLGCACKLRPQSLEEVLRKLPRPTDPAVLVGAETSDDAAVYQLDNETALISTVDFFTPIVDDPHQFGAIAATNALSDIYAMGGRPIFALNMVAFPVSRLPLEVLEEILRGAQQKAREAGIDIVGGHTIDAAEPQFGLAVTGLVHPQKIWRNIGARPGDALILTKALGVGIIATAMKRGLADDRVIDGAIATMLELNRNAAETAAGFTIHACTDVTGFGLLGHLLEMARGSQVDVEIDWQKVPLLEGAWDLAAAGAAPGGTEANLRHIAAHTDFAEQLPRTVRLLLADAQTSGGLVLAVAEAEAQALLAQLQANCRGPVARIGRVTNEGTGLIRVR